MIFDRKNKNNVKEKAQGADGVKIRSIFFATFKIGAITFGGGYAMIPMLEREFVQNHKWMEPSEIVDLFAVGQSLPGVVAVNSSIMIGYRVAKAKGAVAAALGIVLPSLFTLSIIAVFYRQFIENRYVAAAFGGIRAAVAALMIQAVAKLWKQSVKGVRALIICVAAFVLAAFFKVDTLLLIGCGAVLGFVMGIPLIWKNNKNGSEDVDTDSDKDVNIDGVKDVNIDGDKDVNISGDKSDNADGKGDEK